MSGLSKIDRLALSLRSIGDSAERTYFRNHKYGPPSVTSTSKNNISSGMLGGGGSSSNKHRSVGANNRAFDELTKKQQCKDKKKGKK